MLTITFTKFRQQAKNYFDRVEKGEIVRISRHGKPIADIIPHNPQKKSRSKKPVTSLIIPGASLSKAILEERELSRS